MDLTVARRSLRDAGWSSFVASHRAALPFHHPSWAATLAECYGFRAFCLTVDDRSGRIVAGLPVLEVRPRRWVSLPFTDHCPPLVTEGLGAELVPLLDGARRQSGVGRLEVRGVLGGPGVHPDGVFHSHELSLAGTEDEVFASLHANQVRRNIRRARQAGVTIRFADTEADVTGAFYRLHTRTRHRLGVPVQPLRYFRLLWQRVLAPGHGTVLVAELAGVPVAAAVFLASRGVCVYKYGASDERRWSSRPNHLVFWEAIRWARARGCATFDFGRTDVADVGLREFKSRWGTVERQLSYAVLADSPAGTPRGGVPPLVRSMIRRGPRAVPRALGELLYRYTA